MMHNEKTQIINHSKLAKEIRIARMLIGVSQTKLSKLIGVSQATICRLEISTKEISFNIVLNAINILKIELNKQKDKRGIQQYIKTAAFELNKFLDYK